MVAQAYMANLVVSGEDKRATSSHIPDFLAPNAQIEAGGLKGGVFLQAVADKTYDYDKNARL